MRNTLARLVVLGTLFLLQPILAITVTTTADRGAGSLRQTIANATPGETILISATGTITLTSGELLINKNLTIIGPGADKLTIQRSAATGTPIFRIFHVRAGIVTISGLTVKNGRESVGGGIQNETTFFLRDSIITGNAATQMGGGINNLSTITMSNCVVHANTVSGNAGGSGGGINNEGTVIAINCTVRDNSVASGAGGGISNDGTLAITNSLIAANRVAGHGGGIFNEGTLTVDTSTIESNSVSRATGPVQGGGIDNDLGTVTLNRSTVSDNVTIGGATQPAEGGGIANLLGTLILENSTISRNAASGGFGGAIFNGSGSVALNHSTIASNSVRNIAGGIPSSGGGLFNSNGVVAIMNTILAANSGIDLLNGQLADFESSGFNLIGSTNGPVTPGPRDQFNITASLLRLGPLQNNGGPTSTHALLCGSPAINAGDNADAPATDQRGFPRIVDGIIDIGAYEFNNILPDFDCPAPIILRCAPNSGSPGTLSLNVTNVAGDRLVIVWTVNGVAIQTNVVSADTPSGAIRIDFTTLFKVGTNQVTIAVSDVSGCVSSCSTTVTVLARGDLYPIALNQQTLASVPIGGILRDIYNGGQPGNFGWLTWAGSPSEPTLVVSLKPPGNSRTYTNPKNRSDHVVSIGDWVQGKPGISNSDQVRKALNVLKTIDITVPVWDRVSGKGNTSLYHVVAFARVRLLDYQLPKQNRITAQFLGLVDCD